jgi:hypothetical protein
MMPIEDPAGQLEQSGRLAMHESSIAGNADRF